MKYFFLFFIIFIISLCSKAQSHTSFLYRLTEEKIKQKIPFTEVAFFEKSSDNKYGNNIVSHYASLSPDKAFISKIFTDKNKALKLFLPGWGNQAFTLLLTEEKINNTTNAFVNAIDKNGIRKTNTDPGLHYRGYIQGDSTSLASISLFANGDVMGLFAGKEGNFILGKMKNKQDEYVLYKSNDMLIQPRYECGTDKLEGYNTPEAPIANLLPSFTAQAPATLCNKVRLYWEVDNSLYSQDFNSDLIAAQNYATGLFNIFSTLYSNEGISVELSELLIWTTTDPYANTGSSAALNSFRSRWNGLGNNFNGDLAHLLVGGASNYGGIAYVLSNECGRIYNYAYSNVNGNYQAFPNYSWDAMVVTHETGHNLGSKHTHWCGWNTGTSGTCGAIDNCYTLETTTSCPTCTATTDANSPPAGFKGTIMSYCHLRGGIGIDLTNGFGPLPQAVIRNNVSISSCLTTNTTWTGNLNSAWEEPANWSCGFVPNATTDVIILPGFDNYPVINSAAICRSIKQENGTTVEINPEFSLKVVGPPRH